MGDFRGKTLILPIFSMVYVKVLKIIPKKFGS